MKKNSLSWVSLYYLECKKISTVNRFTFESFQPKCCTNKAAKAIHKNEQIPKMNFPVKSLNCGKNEYSKNVNIKHIIEKLKLIG